MSFEAFDVVVVPFPFTDRATVKRRPALVVSDAAAFNFTTGHSVLAMITSAGHESWPLDTPVSDLQAAGLPSASVIRMKLFTLDSRLILRTVGSLARTDRDAVVLTLHALLKMSRLSEPAAEDSAPPRFV